MAGTAKGNMIELEMEKGLKVRMTSSSPFLPGDMTANVYAYYNPGKRSQRLSSTHVMTTDKLDRLVRFLDSKAD
jgi:hypothetical protein